MVLLAQNKHERVVNILMFTDVLGRDFIRTTKFSISVTISSNPIYDNIISTPYFMSHDDDNIVVIPRNPATVTYI